LGTNSASRCDLRRRSVLVSKNGEIARLLGENGCGFTVATKDGETLMRRLLELAGDSNLCASMGVRARVAFERQWDKDQALAKWEALLRGVGEESALQPNFQWASVINACEAHQDRFQFSLRSSKFPNQCLTRLL
jgi:hypothetical protein